MELKRIENPSRELPEVIHDNNSEDGENKAGWVKRTMDKTKDAMSIEAIMIGTGEKMFTKYLPQIKKKVEESIPKMVDFLIGIDEEPKYDIVKVLELIKQNPELKNSMEHCIGSTKTEKLEDLFYSVIVQNVDTVLAYQKIQHKRMIVIELNETGDDIVMQILKDKYTKMETATAIISEGEKENLALERVELARFWANKFLEAQDLTSLMESVNI